jgi:arylsulfatase A-like enzyme
VKKKLAPILLSSLLLIVAFIYFLTRPGSETRPAPINLLLITLDTMRANRLGCYGDSLANTPALDALANGGILFENGYSPVPLTLPAHGSIFTGRWPIAHGVRNNVQYQLAGEELTLAEKLKTEGYETSALVAAYVLKRKFGLDQGFDLYDDVLGYEEKSGNIDAEIPADRVYAKFREWLGRKRDKPFFLWVHFYDPHKPYAPPPAYLKASADDAYRGEVAFVDDHIGRIVADLKEHNLFEQTLIVVAGDHGEAFGEHGENGHGIFCYDESLKVPLIFSNPILLKKPARIRLRMSLVDVMPTVLKMLGMSAAENAQGQSLVAAMAGEEEDADRPIYFESMYGREMNNWAPLTGLISGPFKYISLPQAELYDLQADPGEQTNLFLKDNRLARQMDLELAEFISARQAGRPKDARAPLKPEDKEKLAALGYVSGFAAGGRSGTDPKIGIGYQNRYSELVAALDRGEIARVETEALRLRAETAALKLPFAYTMLNYVYEKKRQWDKLEANLRLACEIFGDNPAQVSAFQGQLLELYLANADFPAAEQLAAEMLRFDPEMTRVLEILGQISEKKQDWSGALNWYLQARKTETGNAALAKKVIKMRLETGDNQAALAESESLLNTDGGANDTDLLFTAAMLAFEAGNGARSEALLLRLTEIQPTARRWFDYALVLGRNGKTGEAIASMEKALAATPNDLDSERRQAAAKALQGWRERRR